MLRRGLKSNLAKLTYSSKNVRRDPVQCGRVAVCFHGGVPWFDANFDHFLGEFLNESFN